MDGVALGSVAVGKRGEGGSHWTARAALYLDFWVSSVPRSHPPSRNRLGTVQEPSRHVPRPRRRPLGARAGAVPAAGRARRRGPAPASVCAWACALTPAAPSRRDYPRLPEIALTPAAPSRRAELRLPPRVCRPRLRGCQPVRGARAPRGNAACRRRVRDASVSRVHRSRSARRSTARSASTAEAAPATARASPASASATPAGRAQTARSQTLRAGRWRRPPPCRARSRLAGGACPSTSTRCRPRCRSSTSTCATCCGEASTTPTSCSSR